MEPDHSALREKAEADVSEDLPTSTVGTGLGRLLRGRGHRRCRNGIRWLHGA
jgi:hypothetical protein